MAFIDKVSPQTFDKYADLRQNTIVDNTLVTGSRALNAIYQNNLNRPILVVVAIAIELYAEVASADLNGYIDVFAKVESVTPPTEIKHATGGWGDVYGLTVDNNDIAFDVNSIFVVPSKYYYTLVTSISGSGYAPTLITWNEIPL